MTEGARRSIISTHYTMAVLYGLSRSQSDVDFFNLDCTLLRCANARLALATAYRLAGRREHPISLVRGCCVLYF